MLTDQQKIELLQKINPIKYTDGKDVFKKYMDEYIVHEKGLFIFGPSGSGKTHFVKNQAEKHWIDGDLLWNDTLGQPDEPWWTMGTDKCIEVDQRCDIITMYAKMLGLWLIGANQFWIRPDAIILPDWETHKEYIISREKNNYDGGATSKDYSQVLAHRSYMEGLSKKENIPVFQSVEEAVEFLTKGNG